VTDMRTQLALTASDLVEIDPLVAVVLAEISVDRFARAMRAAPDRVINVGIMEQALVGVGAGFAMEGFHPIVHTIAPFLVERPLEQVKLDFGYQGLGGTIASVGAPYDYGTEGGTHHAPGDVGVMMTIPGAEVLVPGHANELDALLRGTYANGRLTYLRASVVQNEEAFDVMPGLLHVIRRGTHATVVAVGPMLSRTLAASEGLDVTVLYATSIAPFDAGGLAAAVGEAPLVIAVEPFYEGTLVPALTEALRHLPSRFASIGVPRRFITAYGTTEEHDRDLGMDGPGIRRRLTSILDRMGGDESSDER
jgi:transketolase